VLDEAVKRGEVFVVIARDRNVEKIKNLTPSHNELERMKNVQLAVPTANVVLGDATDFLAPVRAIQPDLILLGYDQRMPPGITEDQLGAPVERLPSFDPHLHKSSILREMK
jgi:FAD synthetase